MEKMKLDLNAPHQKYVGVDGSHVPGVTTILGVLGKDALMPWAAKMEREGVVAHFARGETAATLPRQMFYQSSVGKAADLGTVAHAHIEAWLTGRELDPEGLPEGMWEAALPAFERFKAWWKQNDLTLVESECQLAWGDFGGTIDFVAQDEDGRLVLGDIKTSKANRAWPYPTVIAQVAAYRDLWEKNKLTDIQRIVVVRVGKTEDDKGQQVWLKPDQLLAGSNLFYSAKDAHRALKRLV